MHVVGIDIGSVSVGLVCLDGQDVVCGSYYAAHHGRVREALTKGLAAIGLPDRPIVIACTADTPAFVVGERVDPQIAVLTASQKCHGHAVPVLSVGAQRFLRILIDDQGRYRKTVTSTSCAAGTGSFLDQQARRLRLGGIQELASLALHNEGPRPRIASRCSVFARTDLIHAQQEGYGLEEICDGLCRGLARNIADTLFTGLAEETHAFCGGVSLNPAVCAHLEELLGVSLLTDDMGHLFGAMGAALTVSARGDGCAIRPQAICGPERAVPTDTHPPLVLTLSRYPEFSSLEHTEYLAVGRVVEVDLYRRPPEADVFLGIDIGSTSTKAALTDRSGAPVAGFYTTTSGTPVEAMRALFESAVDLLDRHELDLEIRGVGTTGSGRKFVGAVVGADLVLDEISAHARAAVELDPRVDTIIEIGGQDSKFTRLQDGTVISAQMNTVCAAGTGSFLEEQAERLNCTLEDYNRAEGVRAPLASDRCTVFMERDINQLMARGYATEQVLAAAIHAVRENYLGRVGGELGSRVCFQGATARNRALVAAFEQKLGRPIGVSRFCHLAGALGVALSLSEDAPVKTCFRGIDALTAPIAIRSETCDLCANHCRLRVARVGDDEVAFGFLCGRDYDTPKYVGRSGSGFRLLEERRRVIRAVFGEPPKTDRSRPTVVLPSALHVFEYLSLWEHFFGSLGVSVARTDDVPGRVEEGKRIAGAEFCAPMAALHGHVRQALLEGDLVFLPVTFQAPASGEGDRKYCYYTQYSPAVIRCALAESERKRVLIPLVDFGPAHRKRTVAELHRCLGETLMPGLSRAAVEEAYDAAVNLHQSCVETMSSVHAHHPDPERVRVVLLGRPYTVLSPVMNKGIPDVFDRLGVQALYQDMIPKGPLSDDISSLLEAFHWNYAARILEAAETAARTPGLYPVLVTSFKCTPDSMLIAYLERIMHRAGKPFLILQLDDHDSNVGYETRIEAALRAFRNHASGVASRVSVVTAAPPIAPRIERSLDGRTLLMPRWDTVVHPLLVQALRRNGIDAYLLREDQASIQRSMTMNSGQCLPLSIIAQEVIDAVAQLELLPERAAVWMLQSRTSCNLGLFAHHTKTLLETRGLAEIAVYTGTISNLDLSLRVCLDTYFAYLLGGILRRLVCRIRPYEITEGDTDSVFERTHGELIVAFSGESQTTRRDVMERAVRDFRAIPQRLERRPQVAIFGDLYVRDNDVMNQGLIRRIEEQGGEVVVTPFTEFVDVVARSYFRRWRTEGQLGRVATNKTLLGILRILGGGYRRLVEPLLGQVASPPGDHPAEILGRFDVRLEHDGESYDNLLKVFHVLETHPDVSLFVQASPAYCCPAMVTEAMGEEIERVTGVPVVSLTYDGTAALQNDVLAPYLATAMAR